MHPNERKADRARLVVTRWLPMSFAAAAIAFVIGFVLQLHPQQLITSTALAGVLIFSGLAMRSYGKEREEQV